MKNIWTLTRFEIKRLLTSKGTGLMLLFFIVSFVVSAIFFRLYGSEGSVLTVGNAQSFPIHHLQASLQFSSVFIAIHVATIMTQERVTGTIKLSLLRSVTRGQFYLSRILSTFIFALLLASVTIIAGYIVGLAFFGWGDQLRFLSLEASGWQGVGYTLLAGLAWAFTYFAFGLILLVASLYINQLSTLAVIGGLAVMIGQYAITLPPIKQFTIFQQMLFFHSDLFEKGLSYNLLSLTVVFAYVLIFGGIGYYLFSSQDLYT